jgi:hypothetical protein
VRAILATEGVLVVTAAAGVAAGLTWVVARTGASVVQWLGG